MPTTSDRVHTCWHDSTAPSSSRVSVDSHPHSSIHGFIPRNGAAEYSAAFTVSTRGGDDGGEHDGVCASDRRVAGRHGAPRTAGRAGTGAGGAGLLAPDDPRGLLLRAGPDRR